MGNSWAAIPFSSRCFCTYLWFSYSWKAKFAKRRERDTIHSQVERRFYRSREIWLIPIHISAQLQQRPSLPARPSRRINGPTSPNQSTSAVINSIKHSTYYLMFVDQSFGRTRTETKREKQPPQLINRFLVWRQTFISSSAYFDHIRGKNVRPTLGVGGQAGGNGKPTSVRK